MPRAGGPCSVCGLPLSVGHLGACLHPAPPRCPCQTFETGLHIQALLRAAEVLLLRTIVRAHWARTLELLLAIVQVSQDIYGLCEVLQGQPAVAVGIKQCKGPVYEGVAVQLADALQVMNGHLVLPTRYPRESEAFSLVYLTL